jgi:hypothetical protein
MAYITESQKRMERIYNQIQRSKAELMADYSAVTIQIPDCDKWDYAIPAMYLNYQDGFLFPVCDEYRGMPIFEHPEYGTLFLRWNVGWLDLTQVEKEKYLCFDRHGNKYTVIIHECPEQPGGNPSYFRFLPRVQRYTPTPRAAKLRELRKEV